MSATLVFGLFGRELLAVGGVFSLPSTASDSGLRYDIDNIMLFFSTMAARRGICNFSNSSNASLPCETKECQHHSTTSVSIPTFSAKKLCFASTKLSIMPFALCPLLLISYFHPSYASINLLFPIKPPPQKIRKNDSPPPDDRRKCRPSGLETP